MNKQETYFINILLISFGLASIWLFSPFISSIFFALILASSTNFLYLKLINKYNLTPIVSSSIMVLSISIFIILPFSYLMIEGIIQITHLYNFLSSNGSLFKIDSLYNWLESKQFSQEFINYTKQFFDSNFNNTLSMVKTSALTLSKNVFNNTFGFITFISITLFCLFFFFIDGKKVIYNLKKLSPLNDSLDERIFNKFTYLSSVLTISVFSVSIIQGLSFGIIMGILGMPILFTATLIAIFSFIPVIGSSIIWLPIAFYFGSNEMYFKMIFIIIWGSLVNGIFIDNILRPIIIKKISSLINKSNNNTEESNPLNHTLIIVLSTFAGILHFGILGLFYGPIIAALGITVFEIYIEYNNETKETNLIEKKDAVNE